MGAPELPNDPGEENFCSQHSVPHTPVSSDDEEMEDNLNGYDGYQILPSDETMNSSENNVPDASQNDENEDEGVSLPRVEHEIVNNSNLLPIERADVELERQIWSEPRPSELQIEMDTTKTTQILNLMAGVTLPNVAVPEWAVGVPEERWKEELLQRIRQRKETAKNVTATHSNEE